MKRFTSLIVGGVVAVVAFAGLTLAGMTTTNAAGSVRDCNNNAIIYCGATSPSELVQKYNANTTGDLPAIYNHYGISSAMINGNTEKAGYVTKSGDVVYNGKVVATGAYTAGRQGFTVSTVIKIGNTTIYQHPTSRSFVSPTIQAHIWFDANGQFVAAILYSCGNPVKATPVPVPPKPVFACTSLAATKISRTEFSFTTNASASNGATITGYTYTFGDHTSANGGRTINHTYANAGTYTASVAVHVMVNGQTVTAPGSCTTTVVVTPAMCTIPGKTQFPANSPNCVENKPNVTIEKTVNGKTSDVVMVNTDFTYMITVKNSGNIALQNAVVTDPAPDGVTFESAPVGTISNNSWTTTIASLAVGESKSFTITAKLPAFKDGTITNKACVETPTVPNSKPCDTANITTPKMTDVCDTTTNTVITIKDQDFDSSHMTKDVTQCQNMQVCKLDDKTIVTITRSQFDTTKFSSDTSVCTPTTPPAELPHTGMTDMFSGSLGLGGLVGATYHYGASRRQLKKAMLRD